MHCNLQTLTWTCLPYHHFNSMVTEFIRWAGWDCTLHRAAAVGVKPAQICAASCAVGVLYSNGHHQWVVIKDIRAIDSRSHLDSWTLWSKWDFYSDIEGFSRYDAKKNIRIKKIQTVFWSVQILLDRYGQLIKQVWNDEQTRTNFVHSRNPKQPNNQKLIVVA